MIIEVNNIRCKCVPERQDTLRGDYTKLLKEYLRVRPNNYAFSPLFKARKWDGYRYLITSQLEFATGFFPLVKKFLESEGYQVTVQDKRGDIPRLNTADFNTCIGEIDGVIWDALPDYEHQVRAALSLDNEAGGIYFPRGWLDMATNAGKTSVAALIWLNLGHRERTIFMVSSQLIYKQAVDFFTQVVGEPVGEVCASMPGFRPKGMTSFKTFTIVMVKTLSSRLEKDTSLLAELAKTKLLIVDEADESGAETYSKVLQHIPAPVRVFMSGTTPASKLNKMIAIGLSGPVLAKVTNAENIKAGVSQEPIINILYWDDIKTNLGSYEEEMEALYQSETRAQTLLEKILEHSDKNIVVMFDKIAHGEFLHRYCQSRATNLSMECVHGTTPDRVAIVDDFKSGRINVLFASMIVKRGVNIPNIEVTFNVFAGKDKTTIKQAVIGRTIRKDGKNDTVLIYDFYDEGKYLSAHSRKRLNIYKEEGFQVNYLYPHHPSGRPKKDKFKSKNTK